MFKKTLFMICEVFLFCVGNLAAGEHMNEVRIVMPPGGYAVLTTYEVKNTVVFKGEATLKFNYNPWAMTPDQTNLVQIFRVVKRKNRKIYEKIPTKVDTSAHKVLGQVTKFGTFVVVYPVWKTPKIYSSSDMVSNQRAFSFYAERKISAQVKSPTSSEMKNVVKILLSHGISPITKIYKVNDASQKDYQPYALVSIFYDEGVLRSHGILESSIALYGFNSSGSYKRLGDTHIDALINVISARTYSPYEYYAVFAKTAPIPLPLPDIKSPITSVTYITPVHKPSPYFVYSSSQVNLVLNAYDLPMDTDIASGVYSTYYKLDPQDSLLRAGFTDKTRQRFSVYRSALSFKLTEGRHILAYASVDKKNNYEQLETEHIYVDLTPPKTKLRVKGSGAYSDNGFYSASKSIFSLYAKDRFHYGLSSGVKTIHFLINRSFSECVDPPTFSGPQGTCDNPIYSKPFKLSKGEHTLHFFSIDNVGNAEKHKSISVTVDF